MGSDKRYQTLSVRIQLEEVVAECSIGVGGVDETITAPLCTIHFVQVSEEETGEGGHEE